MTFHPTTKYRKFHQRFGHMRRAYATLHGRSAGYRPYPLTGCVTKEQILQYLNHNEVTIDPPINLVPINDIHVGMPKERAEEIGKAIGSMILRPWREWIYGIQT